MSNRLAPTQDRQNGYPVTDCSDPIPSPNAAAVDRQAAHREVATPWEHSAAAAAVRRQAPEGKAVSAQASHSSEEEELGRQVLERKGCHRHHDLLIPGASLLQVVAQVCA
jgi:hypothetical protein